MHTLLKVTMNDMEAANTAMKEGRMQALFKKTSELISPQSVFFYSENGYRAALYIFDMKNASMIPQIAEPFFNELNAKVEFFPTMDANELMQGLDLWQKQSVDQRSQSEGLS